MFDTGCCGSGLKQNVISKWGVFSLAVPLFYISLFIFIFTWPIGVLIRSLKKKNTLSKNIAIANWVVIQKVQFLSRLKCNLSGGLYQFFPRLSGQVFKVFNIFTFSCLWLVLIISFKFGVGAFV